MKAKINCCGGFRGLLDYLYGPGEDNQPGRAVPVAGAGDDPRERPVWHCSLSLPVGEKLSDEKWAEIARDYLRRMGFDPDGHQWHCVRHTNQEHDHIHLVVSKIALDGGLRR